MLRARRGLPSSGLIMLCFVAGAGCVAGHGGDDRASVGGAQSAVVSRTAGEPDGAGSCPPGQVPTTRFGVPLRDPALLASEEGSEVVGLHCEAVPESCSDLDCGMHGVCEKAGDRVQCQCKAPYTGEHCDQCIYPYERDAKGQCALLASCDAVHCGGEGTCFVDRNGEVACQCPDGSLGCGWRGERVMAHQESIEAGSSLALTPPGGTDCGPTRWTLVSGSGALATDRDGTVRYQAPRDIEGHYELAVIRAVPEGCPDEAQEQLLTVQTIGGVRVTGFTNPQFEGVDEAIAEYMSTNKIIGGSVALSHMGKIVYRRAFGMAGPGDPATPESVFRIASVSKFITRSAVERAIEQGLLSPDLSDNVFDIIEQGNARESLLGIDGGDMPRLPLAENEYATNTADKESWNVLMDPPDFGDDPGPMINDAPCRTVDPNDGRYDPRWHDMTVYDLFSHRGGFMKRAKFIDRTDPNWWYYAGGDTTYEPIWVTRRLGLAQFEFPMRLEPFLHNMAGACFYYPPQSSNKNFLPGDPIGTFGDTLESGDRYSNLGYGLLGELVRLKSGQPYAQFVREHVLDPHGLDLIRLGRTQFAQRHENEAYYYLSAGAGSENYGGNVFEHECSEEDDLSQTCETGVWEFPNEVSQAYGGDWAIEYRQPFGGWTATSCDLVSLTHHHWISTGESMEMDAQPLLSSSLMWGGYPGTRALAWQLPAQLNVATPTGGNVVDDYDDLPTQNIFVLPGYRMAALFNRSEVKSAHAEYDPGLHNKDALTDRVAKALATITLFDADFDETTCAVMPEDPLPPNEYGDCVEGDGFEGCPCEPIDAFASTLGDCAAGDDDACERSHADGAAYDDRFCYGEDVVCGQTQQGNPICKSCGTLPGQIQEGCPCDTVDCNLAGLGCWGNWGGQNPGHCWDMAEPPDHICIESCEDIVPGPNEYRMVCVTPAHGPYDQGTPHTGQFSPYEHSAYCASTGCGGTAFCEEQISQDDGYYGLVCRASSCEAQCQDDADCDEQGYPNWYGCAGGPDDARCVPQ